MLVLGLIGPKGARRLAEATNPATSQPFRADGWGSMAELPIAKAAIEGGMAPTEAFTRHGWSNEAFGQSHPWYSTIDARRALTAQIEHPEFVAAYPEMARQTNAHFSTAAGHDYDRASGGTSVKNPSKDYRDAYGGSAYGMRVQAPDKATTGLNTVAHELNHLVQIDEGFANRRDIDDTCADKLKGWPSSPRRPPLSLRLRRDGVGQRYDPCEIGFEAAQCRQHLVGELRKLILTRDRHHINGAGSHTVLWALLGQD